MLPRNRDHVRLVPRLVEVQQHDRVAAPFSILRSGLPSSVPISRYCSVCVGHRVLHRPSLATGHLRRKIDLAVDVRRHAPVDLVEIDTARAERKDQQRDHRGGHQRQDQPRAAWRPALRCCRCPEGPGWSARPRAASRSRNWAAVRPVGGSKASPSRNTRIRSSPTPGGGLTGSLSRATRSARDAGPPPCTSDGGRPLSSA